ncbi:MAG: DUF302 domain-containing protein [Fimbriimonadaceae bacterium]|nr:DUF302 domain-containing protein [Fimbriimonadaceae bacterium]
MKNLLLGVCLTVLAFTGFSAFAKEPEAQQYKLEMTVESSLPFDQTIEALKMAGAAEKYGFQGLHPLSDILATKGFPREKLYILEICNPKSASDSLKNDVMTGLMMPCPIMIWMKGDKVMVTTFDTRAMAKMYRGKDMASIGDKVYKDLRLILSAVAK